MQIPGGGLDMSKWLFPHCLFSLFAAAPPPLWRRHYRTDSPVLQTWGRTQAHTPLALATHPTPTQPPPSPPTRCCPKKDPYRKNNPPPTAKYAGNLIISLFCWVWTSFTLRLDEIYMRYLRYIWQEWATFVRVLFFSQRWVNKYVLHGR